MHGHITDDELARYSYDPESFPAERQAQIQRHLAACTECDAHFDFYTVFDEDLKDPAVWRPSDASGLMLMRAYRLQCEAEDAEAKERLEPYFANATLAAFANIRKLREFHTGGVVRRLNAEANAIAASNPVKALTFADLAQAIADLLPDNTYPHSIVYELRGTAWKERANALLRLVRFDDALDSLQHADRAFRQLNSSTHGLAAVDLVRAAVYYQREELDKAAFHAEQAEHAYVGLGEPRQRVKALHLRGSIKYQALELDTASAIFEQVMEYGQEECDAEWVAKGAFSRGACELKRGNLSDAARLFNTALVIFRETGPESDRISTEWGLARLVLDGGKPSEAVRRLDDVIDAFEQLGMAMDAAVAGLDMADALLVLNRPEQIVKVASHSFDVLEKAGVLTSALSALAYLKEAAADRRLDPALIEEIRTFLRRTERNPELIFMPPPQVPN